MSIAAIIPARGGSKGIPRKNLMNFCGKPLIAWSIEQALKAKEVNSVWVTSDDAEILKVAESFGARTILRPAEISGDQASSESAWLHAIEVIKKTDASLELIVGMQATSPIRESSDLDSAIQEFKTKGFDSLFSSAIFHDFFIWQPALDGGLTGFNHDYQNRKRRQIIEKNFLENGSFYIFRPENITKWNNRLGGKIGTFVMKDFKKFQIDTPEDIELCTVVMKGYGLAR